MLTKTSLNFYLVLHAYVNPWNSSTLCIYMFHFTWQRNVWRFPHIGLIPRMLVNCNLSRIPTLVGNKLHIPGTSSTILPGNYNCDSYDIVYLLIIMIWKPIGIKIQVLPTGTRSLVGNASALEKPGTWVRVLASAGFFICSVASFLLCCHCEALEGPISTRVCII